MARHNRLGLAQQVDHGAKVTGCGGGVVGRYGRGLPEEHQHALRCQHNEVNHPVAVHIAGIHVQRQLALHERDGVREPDERPGVIV